MEPKVKLQWLDKIPEAVAWCVILPVEVGGSRAGDLLLALSHIEEHGLVWLGPLEVKALLDAVSCGGHEGDHCHQKP